MNDATVSVIGIFLIYIALLIVNKKDDDSGLIYSECRNFGWVYGVDKNGNGMVSWEKICDESCAKDHTAWIKK